MGGAHKQVATNFIGSEPVLSRRALLAVTNVALVKLPLAEHWSDEEQRHEQHKADRTDECEFVPEETFPCQLPERLRLFRQAFSVGYGNFLGRR